MHGIDEPGEVFMRTGACSPTKEKCMRKYVFAATAAVLMSACSTVSLSSAPLAMRDGMLVNDKGMTVYMFDKDVANSGKSACNDKCVVNWPPVLATAKDQPQGPYTIVVRDD